MGTGFAGGSTGSAFLLRRFTLTGGSSVIVTAMDVGKVEGEVSRRMVSV